MKTRYRLAWNGKLILQVQETVMRPDFSIRLQPGVSRMRPFAEWRDAMVEDLSLLDQPEFKTVNTFTVPETKPAKTKVR